MIRRTIVTLAVGGALSAVTIAQLAGGDSATSRDRQGAVPSPPDAHHQSLIQELEALAREHPDDAAIHLKLAFTFMELGADAQARHWLAEAAAIDPHLYEDAMHGLHANGESAGEGGAAGGTQYPVPGPDVIVGDLQSLQRWGRVGNITAYSVGTDSCNAGDTPLLWIASTNQHPVIAQHMYRYKDGRFEMIGQSWVKHGFTALTLSLCASQFGYGCQGPGGGILSPGCSDPYGAGLNGSYSSLGPKHEINPTTGFFPYPYGSYPNNSPIGKRLQVHDDDLKPELNVGAVYYVEGHYIAADDAAAGNDLNNASYRRVNVTETQPFEFNLSFVPGHSTVRELPAIYAWQTHDPDVVFQELDVANDGRFIVAYRTSDNGDGTWHYEYAVHNLNSDRAAGRFTLPVPAGVTVTNVGFRSVAWHSGAPYGNAPWNSVHENGELTWSTDSFDQNPNANALRWGTLYNFRFDADAPPEDGAGEIGMFKPGEVNDVGFAAAVPEGKVPDVPGDLTGNGSVGVADLLILLAAWGKCDDCAPGTCPADLDGNCAVGVADLLILLQNWG